MNIRSNAEQFAEVACDARFQNRRTTLTYSVPATLSNTIEIGQLIWVPLRRGLVLGIVTRMMSVPPPGDFKVRAVHALVEPEFKLSPIQWHLAVWIATETICSLFEAASPMLPPGVGSRAVEHIALVRQPDEEELSELTALQRRLVVRLIKNAEMTLDAARAALDTRLTSVIPALEDLGILKRIVKVRHRPVSEPEPTLRVRLPDSGVPPPSRAYRQLEAYEWLSRRLRTRPDRSLPFDAVLSHERITRQILTALAERGSITIEPDLGDAQDESISRANPVQLTAEQQAAFETVRSIHHAQEAEHILLYGVTGSGKTEVYFRVIADVIAEGRSGILLVPEIALAGQIIERARARFGAQALILHSALDDRTRHENWKLARSGEPVVVVGPRSALFAPLPSIGVIILDEEHESAYKQDNPPRYHARTVAQRLAHLHKATLILGSATPAVESYYASSGASWRRLELTERIGQRVVDRFGDVRPWPIPLPKVEIIDLRGEFRAGNASIFSRELAGLLQARVKANEQSILFLNRRGMSTFVQCKSCGSVHECPFCDIPLVYHRTNHRLVCHRCGHRALVPRQCSDCGSANIGYYGTGTQRVEQEITNLLPGAKILRWDQDALRGGVTHEQLLNQVRHDDIDIVVGTQMVSKGLDLPKVTLVGVINADTYIHLPDFRSAERTFQMLAQVAGRAGRRAVGGQVIIQTYSPHHYAISSAAQHDYPGFYKEELAFRRRHGYPPFKRLVRLLYRHRDHDESQHAAEVLTDIIERYLVAHSEYVGIDILGPAPAFAARVRAQYGWQILLRGDASVQILGGIKIPFGWNIDVDPVNML